MEWFSASDDWLSRWVFERGLAITYLIAFAVVLNQFRPLLGEHGLLPVPRFVAAVPVPAQPQPVPLALLRPAGGGGGVGRRSSWRPRCCSRSRSGPRAPVAMACWALLWVLYLSVVNVGQRFYSFGWESLLLEVGFLACFLGGSSTAPPVIVMFLLRWLLFRLELGAGLIKLRGDPCWRNLTCLEHHHETQPMPGPLSPYFHHLPKALHRVEVLANHTAQLVVPWFLFAPEPVSTIAAVIIVVTQGYLMISGNFSWLNFLTIALGLSVIDGSVLGPGAADRPAGRPRRRPPTGRPRSPSRWRRSSSVRSIPIVANLLSPHQRMNASFDRLHLVNTYGAFGSVTKVRREVIIEGTLDERPGPDTEWLEYEVRGKPGDVRRRPPQVAPYHLRLGWLLWFVALSPSYGEGWFRPLLHRLLEADRRHAGAVRPRPLRRRSRPAFVRARLFRYELTTRQERRETGAWWRRQPTGTLQAPMGFARR